MGGRTLREGILELRAAEERRNSVASGWVEDGWFEMDLGCFFGSFGGFVCFF